MNGKGCKPDDADWTQKYFVLRKEIDELTIKLTMIVGEKAEVILPNSGREASTT